MDLSRYEKMMERRMEKAAADKLQYISYLTFHSKINVHMHIRRFCGICPGF